MPAEWSGWASLGGTILPGFAVGQNGLGRLEVFAVEKANHRPPAYLPAQRGKQCGMDTLARLQRKPAGAPRRASRQAR